MCFLVILNEILWKEIYLTVILSSHCFTNICSLLRYQVLPAFLKLLFLKKWLYVLLRQCSWCCLLSRWRKHKEKWTNKSSADQDEIVTVHKTYLNDWKKYLITFQVVVLCKSSSNLNIVILSNLDNIWCILNEWRIFSEHTFLLHLYQQKFKMQQ